MKAIVIAEPWISLILAGTKTWEMRGRPCRHRGPVALIRKGSGQVVGLADLADSRPALTDGKLSDAFAFHQVPHSQFFCRGRARWRCPWILEKFVSLEPVSYSHPKGAVIWVNLDPAVADAISSQLESMSR